MESNYIKSLQIKVTKHPEWDEDRIWEEAKRIYKHSKNMIYRTKDKMIIIPVEDNKPIKFIYEGGQYEKQLYDISRT